MEEVLLSYYFLLSSRKAITGSIDDFWEMDTYTTYTLRKWVLKQIEEEKKEIEKNKNPQKRNDVPELDVEEDPKMDDMYNDYISED